MWGHEFVWLQFARQKVPLYSNVSMPIILLVSLEMADLQRDRDSTVVLEQINTVHQRNPDLSDSSTNSIMSAGSSPSTGLQRQSSNLDKNLITYCARKKKKKEEKSATEHVRFIIIESLENVQADLN